MSTIYDDADVSYCDTIETCGMLACVNWIAEASCRVPNSVTCRKRWEDNFVLGAWCNLEEKCYCHSNCVETVVPV